MSRGSKLYVALAEFRARREARATLQTEDGELFISRRALQRRRPVVEA